MSPFYFFALQYTLSFLVYGMLTAWYVWPRLKTWQVSRALMALLLLHMIRHIGLGSIIPVATDPALSVTTFAMNQAWGDLAAMVLATAAFIALRFRWNYAWWLVWIFNLEGFYDLGRAVFDGIRIQFWNFQLGAFWNVITMLAPALFVFHLCIFAILFTRSADYRDELQEARGA